MVVQHYGATWWNDRRSRTCGYGVATVSRIDKIIGLFCKRAQSKKRRYSAKETYNFIDPTDLQILWGGYGQ